MKYGIFINSETNFHKDIRESQTSSPIPILGMGKRRSTVSFGLDNPGHTISNDEIEDESDSGFSDSSEMFRRPHRNSIVSCASFERLSFMNCISNDDKDNNRSRRLSLQAEDFDTLNQRFKAFLHNRFGSTGADKVEIRNGSGIYHIYNGSVIVTDVLGSNLLIYNGSGRLSKCIPIQKGTEPWTTAATPNGDFAVALSKESCVSVLSCTGVERLRFGEDVLEYPSGIIVDRKNRYIVTDTKQNKVHIFSENGEVLRSIPDDDDKDVTLKSPRHVTLSHHSNIIVSDSGNHCIRVFDRHGDYVNTFGKYGSGDGELKFPYGVSTDHKDNIIVADYYNNRVSLFSNKGKFIQHLVTPHMGLKRPQALTIRHYQSTFVLYITYGDMKANKIVAYKIVDSENEHVINGCTHAKV